MSQMIAKRHILAGALRVAADQYDADALSHSIAPPENPMPAEGRQRLVDCFAQQALDARALADQIEQSDKIALED
jgi:hypothetical protein